MTLGCRGERWASIVLAQNLPHTRNVTWKWKYHERLCLIIYVDNCPICSTIVLWRPCLVSWHKMRQRWGSFIYYSWVNLQHRIAYTLQRSTCTIRCGDDVMGKSKLRRKWTGYIYHDLDGIAQVMMAAGMKSHQVGVVLVGPHGRAPHHHQPNLNAPSHLKTPAIPCNGSLPRVCVTRVRAIYKITTWWVVLSHTAGHLYYVQLTPQLRPCGHLLTSWSGHSLSQSQRWTGSTSRD